MDDSTMRCCWNMAMEGSAPNNNLHPSLEYQWPPLLLPFHPSSSMLDPTPWSTLSSSDHLTILNNNDDNNNNNSNQIQMEDREDGEEELGGMKETMYKIAAMQAVDIDPATIRKPKRRNVRISDDPQSVAARHRRERISEKIRILQRLVPGGTKMDTASMLDEAIRYLKFLKRQIRHLQSNSSSSSSPLVLGFGLPLPLPHNHNLSFNHHQVIKD